MGGQTLDREIARIAEDYFGPAAPRFINRITINHLGKEPRQITAQDLPELIRWIKLTVSMMTEETATIDEFIARLNALAGKKSPSRPKVSRVTS